MKFEVLTIKLNDLQKEFDKINKKKFVSDNDSKLSFVKLRDFKDNYGEFRTEIEVSGLVPNCGDYELIAVLNKITDEQNIVNVVPSKTLPEEYRYTDFYCDHCNINRYRKQVIVVKSLTEGKYLQVGRQCVKDYFSREVEDVVRKYEYLWEAIGLAENGEKVGDPYINTRYFLAVCHALLRKVPFYPSGSSLATKQSVWDIIVNYDCRHVKTFIKESNYELLDSDWEEADKAIEWLNNNPDNSDFFYNLRTIVKCDSIESKFIGYAAALINVYNKALDKQLTNEIQHKVQKVSNWVGEPKDRLEKTAKCVFTKVIDGYYGEKTIVKFVTDEGDIITWFASGVVEKFEENNDYKVKFTVKKHDEFRNEKQTIVTRVKEAV